MQTMQPTIKYIVMISNLNMKGSVEKTLKFMILVGPKLLPLSQESSRDYRKTHIQHISP